MSSSMRPIFPLVPASHNMTSLEREIGANVEDYNTNTTLMQSLVFPSVRRLQEECPTEEANDICADNGASTFAKIDTGIAALEQILEDDDDELTEEQKNDIDSSICGMKNSKTELAETIQTSCPVIAETISLLLVTEAEFCCTYMIIRPGAGSFFI